MPEQIHTDPMIAALLEERDELRQQLEEASDTLEAIRTGQVDALVMNDTNVHRLYTLRTADQTYRLFIEKMSEGAVTLTPTGMILFCNSQFAFMAGTEISQIAGNNLDSFIAEEDRPALKILLEKSMEAESKIELLLQGEGKSTPVLLSCSTLEMEEGVNLSMIITDLTVQKQTEAQLIKNNRDLAVSNEALEVSNRDLQQFASVASHDLQEPLRKIQVFSNLLREAETGLTDDSETYLKKIIESAARMRTLIIDILSYSRLSGGNNDREEVDLNNIMQDLREDLELMISDKKALFIIKPLPVIVANKGQIRQVLHNIINNAMKFSKPDTAPVITVNATKIAERSFTAAADEQGPFYRISIEDNGIGFDEVYLSSVFALFERLNPKDKYEGTGIGMAIAKKIVEKHNGLISAESAEGKGARFNIILPV